MAHTLRAPSEIWLHRMIDELKDKIVAFALDEPVPKGADGVDLRGKKKHFLKLIKNRRVSSILIHYLTNAIRFQSTWEQTKKPVWVHVHGWDITWKKRSHEGELVHPADYIERVLTLPQNVRFIANSHCSQEKLLSIGIDPSRIWVNHLGVIPEPREEKGEGCQILYLGRLVDFKGPDKVIRAFEIASSRGLNATLVMAGTGPLMPMCQMMRCASPCKDRIRLLGPVSPEVGKRLRAQSHLFTAHNCTGPITGQEEALGVSFLEAMGAGIPVVTGWSGGILETIRHGEQGLLFEPGDVEAHASALLRLSKNQTLREELGKSAQQHVLSHFSLQDSCRRLALQL